MTLVVSLSVVTEDREVAAHSVEMLTTAAAALAREGISVSLSLSEPNAEDDE